MKPDFIKAAGLLQEMAQSTSSRRARHDAHGIADGMGQRPRGDGLLRLWLKNEMKKALPPDFEIDCFAVPPVEGVGATRRRSTAAAANFFVFKDAKHPREAADFLKFMVSEANALLL